MSAAAPYSIVREDGKVLAADLTDADVCMWWMEDQREYEYFGLRMDGHKVIVALNPSHPGNYNPNRSFE